MKPAYHISLTAEEKRQIAEIGAIQTQIEWLMMLTVKHLLDVSVELARAIMGSTNVRANSEIWINVVREKHPFDEAREWAEWAYLELEEAVKSRNDFMHTLYGFVSPSDGNLHFLFGHMVMPGEVASERKGLKAKTHKQVSLDGLRTIRDRACYLSMAFAHIEDACNPEFDGSSPWRKRLGGSPPRPNEPWSRVRQRAKAPRARRGSSPA